MITYNTLSQTWTTQNAGGLAIFGHTTVAYNGSFIVYGGQTVSSPTNNVWTFDVRKNNITLLQVAGDIPPATYRHAAAIVKSRMYVFGGRNDSTIFNTVSLEVNIHLLKLR